MTGMIIVTCECSALRMCKTLSQVEGDCVMSEERKRWGSLEVKVRDYEYCACNLGKCFIVRGHKQFEGKVWTLMEMKVKDTFVCVFANSAGVTKFTEF